jgi:hypothetical protein
MREEAVSSILGIKDPYKVASYIVDNKNPAAALKNLLAVSGDSAWTQSIQGLVKEELKKRIGKGQDVFTDPKVRSILTQLYNPSQIKQLKSYQTLLNRLDTARSGTRVDTDAGDSVAHAAYTLTSISPVGLGALYAVKQLLKGQIKGSTSAYERAVMQYIDDALIRPDKAQLITDAFAGSKYGKKKLADELNSFADYIGSQVRVEELMARKILPASSQGTRMAAPQVLQSYDTWKDQEYKP